MKSSIKLFLSSLCRWASGKAGFYNVVSTSGVRFFDLISYLFIIGVSFFLFQQTDMFHTSISSYAFLNGHFADFYDYNKTIVIQNDYLPIVYAIFSIWNVPLFLAGVNFTSIPTEICLGIVPMLWNKSLIVIFFLATAGIVCKCAKLLSTEEPKASIFITQVFLTAPIALFAIFVFGQYDIVGLFFAMLGFFFYLNKRIYAFAWCFSIAIGFKYFSLIIFIPLLLLSEKDLFKVLKLMIIATLVTLFQVSIYWNNLAFRDEIFGAVGRKVLTDGGSSFRSPMLKFLIFYAAICLFAFVKRFKSTQQWHKSAVYTAFGTYAAFFLFLEWHPQWLIYITPFISLTLLYVRDKRLAFACDVMTSSSFLLLVVYLFPNNVDVTMLRFGAFRSFFGDFFLKNSELLPQNLYHNFHFLFNFFLFSPFWISFYENWCRHQFALPGTEIFYFRLRYYTIFLFFIVPTLFCALAPLPIATLFNPSAFVTNFSKGLVILPKKKLPYDILQGTLVSQEFMAEANSLCAVSIAFATHKRINKCNINFRLVDDAKREVFSKTVSASLIRDNMFFAFQFPPISNSLSKNYTIEITSSNTKDADSITTRLSEDNEYPYGALYVNGVRQQSDLSFCLYYRK